MRRLFLLVATVLLFGYAAPAVAQTDQSVSQAAAALRGTNVYVAPDSGQDVTASEIQTLQRQIAGGRATIYLAVLPESAGTAAGGVDGLPHTLSIAMGDPTAVFGVVSGHSFRAGAKAGAGLDAGEAANFAKQAVAAHSPAHERLVAALSDFVTRVNNRVAGRTTGHTGTTSAPGKKSNAGTIVLIVLGSLVVLTLLIVGGWLIYRKRREAQRIEDYREHTKLTLEAVSGQVLDLEDRVKISKQAEAATSYANGVRHYQQANDKWSDHADESTLDSINAELDTARSAFRDTESWLKGVDPNPPAPKRTRRVVDDEPVAARSSSGPPPGTQPTQTQTVNVNYPGRDYGYYPGYGWGYYGYNGDFVTGMLVGEAMADRHDNDRDDDNDRRDEPAPSSYEPSDSGSGDWGSSGGGSDFGGSGDWGGGGGGDFGGGGGDSGGGGGDW